jgi:hypothetical protein
MSERDIIRFLSSVKKKLRFSGKTSPLFPKVKWWIPHSILIYQIPESINIFNKAGF